MSALATSFSKISKPSGCVISSVTPRLLVLRYRNRPLVSGFVLSPGNGPRVRERSPMPGRSILITSAPMSANSLLQYGAETISPTSTIFKLDNAPAINAPFKKMLLGKYLPERLHLDALEDAARRVRIALRKCERFRLALHVDDDQTTAAVSKRSRDLDLARRNQRSQIFQMCRPNLRPQPGALGSIVADNHEQHRMVLSRSLTRSSPETTSNKLISTPCSAHQSHSSLRCRGCPLPKEA